MVFSCISKTLPLFFTTTAIPFIAAGFFQNSRHFIPGAFDTDCFFVEGMVALKHSGKFAVEAGHKITLSFLYAEFSDFEICITSAVNFHLHKAYNADYRKLQRNFDNRCVFCKMCAFSVAGRGCRKMEK